MSNNNKNILYINFTIKTGSVLYNIGYSNSNVFEVDKLNLMIRCACIMHVYDAIYIAYTVYDDYISYIQYTSIITRYAYAINYILTHGINNIYIR